MNKNAIKKFAIDARNKLIASVTDKAGMLGITPDNCSEAITKGADFEVYKTAAGTEVTLNKKQCEQRGKLVDQIHARGFEAVVEEVAYTWFNRICAIRFMEVNDYMYPVRVRVLSSEKKSTVSGLVKNEPDVVTMAPDIDWDFTDEERKEIIDAKMNNRLDDLFRMLFIKQCNLLHEVLPGLFEETEDYKVSKETLLCEDYELFMRLRQLGKKGYNIQKTLFTYREDANSYKRRDLNRSINEAKVRYVNFKKMHILFPKGWIYVIRPIAACMIPRDLLYKVKRKKSWKKEIKTELIITGK